MILHWILVCSLRTCTFLNEKSSIGSLRLIKRSCIKCVYAPIVKYLLVVEFEEIFPFNINSLAIKLNFCYIESLDKTNREYTHAYTIRINCSVTR